MGLKFKDSIQESVLLRNEVKGPHTADQLLAMRQVALHFTDLHDNPAALFNASRIRKIVPWKDARRFFYFRLKRLLLQNETRLRAW